MPTVRHVGSCAGAFTRRSYERRATPRILRLLMIEDNPERVALIQSWLPPDVRLVVAASAGRAIGLLGRDPGRVYAGVLLDHDLQMQAATDDDRALSGTEVLHALLTRVSREVPVLIHSVNTPRAIAMATRLDASGFSVTRIPMPALTEERFLAWLQEVREEFEAGLAD